MSATWPRRCRCCGRRPRASAASIDDGTIRISDAVERLRLASRADAPRVLAAMLDHLDASGRFALLKLATGALRVGISARLAKQALADAFGLDVEQVEEVWHGLRPPYRRAVRLGRGRARRSRRRSDVPVFRPFMLAHPLEEARVSPRRLCRRVEMGRDPRPAGPCRRRDPALQPHRRRHFSGSFPDIAAAFAIPAVLDGELLVRGEAQGAEAHGGAAASFNALQQRLGRKNVSAKMQGEYPAFVRLYDILFDGDEDLRALPWTERRARLEAFVRAARSRAVRPVAADRGGRLRAARGNARRRPRRRRSRG